VAGNITIALDAMGGDHAPATVVQGADLALERHPQARFLIFGEESRIAPLMARLPRLAGVATVHHTSEMVQDDDKPSQALRAGRQTSMRMAIEAVADGRADGIVSAGNTGALMAIAKFVLKTLPGIDRPAIATFFPTTRGETVMLDLGANIECDADNLVQFALMGDVFARTVLGLVEPTVGLLNVGSEDLKGNDAVRGAAARLRGGMMPIRFHGFVEGNDITAGTVDVVVTDGFSGNVALKTVEGTVRMFSQSVRAAFGSSLSAKLGYLLARGALRKMQSRLDPRRYNGAMFLGLRGIAVKSHGSTDAFGFANAISVAIDLKLLGFLDKIRAELQRLNDAQPTPQAVSTAAL
jgi:glycerol-3-phosphate acyltransferase PlsX